MSDNKPPGRLIVVLGDQLSDNLSALEGADPKVDQVLMAELFDEAHYVKHHRKKIILIFSAMRHFARKLRSRGFTVHYFEYQPERGEKSFVQLLKTHHELIGEQGITVTECGEYRLAQQIKSWGGELGCPVEILPDLRFVSDLQFFEQWIAGQKRPRMEYFYREVRRSTGLLMDGAEPEGGQWNYDHDNRNRWPGEPSIEGPYRHQADDVVDEVTALVNECFPNHIGSSEDFWFAVTAEQAEQSFEHFLQHSLSNFGDYQDAMHTDQKFLFHSIISMYINIGLLDPLTVCKAVEDKYRLGEVPINSAEGFIRQIIGWREYVRGLYWHLMPDYKSRNALESTRKLPEFFWTAGTKMSCMKASISASLDEAYAHHIQRLMVTGNFALLCGLDVEEVCDWYLAIYADAFEWVELPNTLGMALYGDGGFLASKPYAASGKYIQRMSNYCADCEYNYKTAEEDDSCPFNSLYWDFIARHEDKFSKHPRMAIMYKSLRRMKPEKVNAMRDRATWILDNLDSL